MGLIHPTLPPYDALDWQQQPFPTRARMVCEAWALQGYGTPAVVFALYGLKIIAYIAVWIAACTRSPDLGGVAELGQRVAVPRAPRAHAASGKHCGGHPHGSLRGQDCLTC